MLTGAQRPLLLTSSSHLQTAQGQVVTSGSTCHPQDSKDSGRTEDPEQGRRWADLIRLEFLPHSLEGVSALTEHGLKQTFLRFFTFSLHSGKMGQESVSGRLEEGTVVVTPSFPTCADSPSPRSFRHSVCVSISTGAVDAKRSPGARVVSHPIV